MDRRAFLTAAGAAAFVFDRSAVLAAEPVEATAVRASPTEVKIDWKGAAGAATVFTAAAPYATGRALKRLAAAPAGTVQVVAPASPRPYFLVQARGGAVWTAERLLPLQGGRNFRDLGGYRAEGGRQVRWGKLYRSGAMSGLTPADMGYLRALGVTTVCDLRSPQERTAEPSPFLAVADAHVATYDYDMNASLEALARVRTREDAIGAFAEAYVAFLDTLKPNYADLFARLVAGEAPLAFNCSAGKDRTGTASALILSVLGVPRETIVADYALTQVYTPPSYYMQAMSQPGAPATGLTAEQAEALRRLPQDVLLVIMGSDPGVMRQALQKMDERYGGPVALAKARFGLTDAGIERMRRLYLA